VEAKPKTVWNPAQQDLQFHSCREDRVHHLKEYRTVFGPFFMSKTNMYATDIAGLRGAVRRLTCVREPGIPGYHEQLKRLQDICQERLFFLPGFLAEKSRILRGIYNGVVYSAEQLRQIWTDQPHPKKLLRARARRAIWGSGRTTGPRVKRVSYKCKPGELLPDGKYLRAVGDLTTPGSTAGGYIMDMVKGAFEVAYSIDGNLMRFVKTPAKDDLSRAFQQLHNPVKSTFVFFSDDSCFSFRCRDGVFMCNLDISQCDGSNFDVVFQLLKGIMRQDGRFNLDIDAIFAQCLLPCVVRNPFSKERVTFTPRHYTLYSGSVLTTSINNTANSLIWCSILQYCTGDLYMRDMPSLIAFAAAQVGFIVKCIVAPTVEHLQFLKHSCSIVDGVYTPWLNIGVMLRSFGMCKGDLPGVRGVRRPSVQLRASAYLSDVVRSWAHGGDHLVTDSFRNRFIIEQRSKLRGEEKRTRTFRGAVEYPRIPLEYIANRYGLCEYELEELVALVSSSQFGHGLHTPAVAKILSIDYGY